MYFFSTEVTSSKIVSDKPLFQRTRKAYEAIVDLVYGNTLEIGCGEGYGVELYYKNVSSLTLIDKSFYAVKTLKTKYPEVTVLQQKLPPLRHIPDNSFDSIICFQVIEHIKNDHSLIKEIRRVLKPGGKAYITTPNAKKTIARNPWHYKEYDFDQLKALVKEYFTDYEIKGIEGNDKTDQYYRSNEVAVKKLLELDILKMQHRIPSIFLKIPYELLNRINRKKLLKKNRKLIETISSKDYSVNGYSAMTLDFFCILIK